MAEVMQETLGFKRENLEPRDLGSSSGSGRSLLEECYLLQHFENLGTEQLRSRPQGHKRVGLDYAHMHHA